MNGSIQFVIHAWAAWAPGISSLSEWQSYTAGERDIDPEARADVSFLPAMQRRRLSPLARAVFSVINQVQIAGTTCPSVFCSTYGECQRTCSILETISKDEDVSPTAFSLSVHNAISGQYTILFNNQAETTALAPKAEDYLVAIADGIGRLKNADDTVLVVFYEEQVPDFYKPYAISTEFPCALAIRIGLPGSNADDRYELSLDTTLSSHHPAQSTLPPLEALINALANHQPKNQLGRWTLNMAQK